MTGRMTAADTVCCTSNEEFGGRILKHPFLHFSHSLSESISHASFRCSSRREEPSDMTLNVDFTPCHSCKLINLDIEGKRNVTGETTSHICHWPARTTDLPTLTPSEHQTKLSVLPKGSEGRVVCAPLSAHRGKTECNGRNDIPHLSLRSVSVLILDQIDLIFLEHSRPRHENAEFYGQTLWDRPGRMSVMSG